MRPALALVAGVLLGVLGALIIGEQLEVDINGALPIVAAGFFGLVEAEVLMSVSARNGPSVRIAGAVLAGAGVAWGVWIASGRGTVPLALTAWLAPAVAAGVAAVWVRRTPSSQRDSPVERS